MRTLKLAAAASILLAGVAHAVPQSFVAISPSSFSISMTVRNSNSGTATGSGAVTGTASTDITVTPTNASTVGGSGGFDVADFTAPGSIFGAVAMDNFHVDVTLPATTSTNGTNPFNPDLGGTVISVDNGQVNVPLTNGGTQTIFDFSKTPALATEPTGTLTTLDAVAQTWAIPFTTTTTIASFNLSWDFVFGTDLVLQTVPEPGTLLLLGAGLAGLAATRRRRGIAA